MDSKWRPRNWTDFKSKVIAEDKLMREIVDKLIEFGATAILEAYFNSDEFGEDASEYCRCQGWEEPR